MWLLSDKKKLLAQLEIDYVVVILREKKLCLFIHIERFSGAIKTFSLRHADRKAWPREAQDDMDDTNRERPL